MPDRGAYRSALDVRTGCCGGLGLGWTRCSGQRRRGLGYLFQVSKSTIKAFCRRFWLCQHIWGTLKQSNYTNLKSTESILSPANQSQNAQPNLNLDPPEFSPNCIFFWFPVRLLFRVFRVFRVFQARVGGGAPGPQGPLAPTPPPAAPGSGPREGAHQGAPRNPARLSPHPHAHTSPVFFWRGLRRHSFCHMQPFYNPDPHQKIHGSSLRNVPTRFLVPPAPENCPQ